MTAAELNFATTDTLRRRGVIIFLVGFFLFGAAQTSLTVVPVLDRLVPPWPIDAYMYMGKARQVRDCFRQDCPAMETLRPQLTTPTDDPDLRTIRDRQYHRVLYQYHLLHSFGVERLERLTGDWRLTYDAVAIAGGVLMVLSIAAFVAVLFGPAAGGVGLAILSTAVFPGYHGIHWIVPSNMALALGSFCWAFLLSRHRYALACLPVFVLAMVTLHTVGQIYAAIAIAGFVSFRRRVGPWLWIGLALLIAAANATLPRFVDRPALSLLRETLPADVGWWQAIGDNVAASWEHASAFGEPFGGPAMLLFLTILGLLTVQPSKRTTATFVGLLLGGLCLAGALYVMPHYPAEVFRRVWIPFVVFAVGAMGTVACCVVAGAIATVRDHRRHAPAVAGTLALSLLVIGGGAATAILGLPELIQRHFGLRTTADFALDRGQPGRILQAAGGDAGVVYMDEMTMYVYLLYGGLEHEAVYYPAVDGSPAAAVLTRAGNRWAVSAGLHPSKFMQFTDGAWLPRSEETVVTAGPGDDFSAAAVRLRTYTEPVEIEALLEWPSGERRGQRFSLSPDGFHWLDLPAAPGATTLTLRHVDGGFSRLSGLRLEPGAVTNWPWDRGVTVTPTPSEDIDETVIRFDSADLVPAECESGGVLDDSGGMVAVAVQCGRPVEPGDGR